MRALTTADIVVEIDRRIAELGHPHARADGERYDALLRLRVWIVRNGAVPAETHTL